MADAVRQRELPTFHQALHGYADGHRQLAVSVSLSPRDSRTMLVLSDIAGSGARLEGVGYLTGYPLVESGVYALARTWPAPEMPRPGCVWTHTILIDFTDLATLSSLADVTPLFRRPEGPSFGEYSSALRMTHSLPMPPPLKGDLEWGARLLAGIYGAPHSKVFATRPEGVDADAIVLAIWSQQWPRLRRAFRFCTLAASDRSSEGSSFDLQLLSPMDRSLKAAFQNAVDADKLDLATGPWLDDAIADLDEQGASDLRSFLHRVGGDVSSGREAFRPLCCLHTLIKGFGDRPGAMGEALAVLDEAFEPSQAKSARSIVVSAAVSQAAHLDDPVFSFVLGNIELADANALALGAETLGRTIWERDPARLAPLLEHELPAVRHVVEQTIDTLPGNTLADGLKRSPILMTIVLSRRPSVVTEPTFWLLDNVGSDEVFRVIEQEDGLALPAVGAMIAAGRNDLVHQAVQRLGAFRILQAIALQYESGTASAALASWMLEATRDRHALAQLLSGDTLLPRAFLAALVQVTDADDVPNDFGTDPWLAAMENATGPLTSDAKVTLNAYLLCRAFGTRSRNAAELAQIGFESTYRAAESNCLSSNSWKALERRLPWSLFWFDWDRCPRLRAGIVALFVGQDLSPQVFAHIVHDDGLFAEIAKATEREVHGRDFLERTYWELKNETGNRSDYRIRVIEDLVLIAR